MVTLPVLFPPIVIVLLPKVVVFDELPIFTSPVPEPAQIFVVTVPVEFAIFITPPAEAPFLMLMSPVDESALLILTAPDDYTVIVEELMVVVPSVEFPKVTFPAPVDPICTF